MWKSLVFNAALFWVVAYLGDKNKVDCVVLALVFAGLHHVLYSFVNREFMNDFMPDTTSPAPCPKGTVSGDHHPMDCKIPSDKYGM
jgi:hypothetical protein